LLKRGLAYAPGWKKRARLTLYLSQHKERKYMGREEGHPLLTHYAYRKKKRRERKSSPNEPVPE